MSNNNLHRIVKLYWGQLLALLIKILKDVELSEDALQDALESAFIHWSKNGVPQNPKAWLLATAKHKAIDKIRRSKNFEEKKTHYQQLLDIQTDTGIKEDEYSIPDERLRLIFTCCHPALAPNISVALTLQLLGGLTTLEIAKAFLVKSETMAQRLVRGKRKIKQAKIPFSIPDKDDFSDRINNVLMVLYLIFNEGYSASTGAKPIRHAMSDEAIRLTQILLKLCPSNSEVKGLLALMYLHDSRKPARFSMLGEFIPLEKQNRLLWDKQRKQEGLDLIQSALKQKHIGCYQLQAVISAIHAEAKDYQSTNWHEIILVYNELIKYNPTDVVRLNRLVAVSQINLDENLLEELIKLGENLTGYQPYFVVKADFLEKMGHVKAAESCYKQAIELTENTYSKKYLYKKLNGIKDC